MVDQANNVYDKLLVLHQRFADDYKVLHTILDQLKKREARLQIVCITPNQTTMKDDVLIFEPNPTNRILNDAFMQVLSAIRGEEVQTRQLLNKLDKVVQETVIAHHNIK